MTEDPLASAQVRSSVDSVLLNALQEDIGNGDLTTSAIIPEHHRSDSALVAKGDFVLAGMPFAERVFGLIDSELMIKTLKKDGKKIKKGNTIARISGNTRSLLLAERTALNILQRMSGIATLTARFVSELKGLPVTLADTRKTAPGLRFFDKYAVRAGGGVNHRYGLYDGILIKDNHISAAGGIKKAVLLARAHAHHLIKVEVETRNITEVREALKAGADVIMLDNMNLEQLKKSIDIIRSNDRDVTIEVSGNVHLGNIKAIAETGPDLISVGAVTHSAAAADISMRFD